ncbi:hypothetical protein HNP98_002258 [Hymenobacter sp. 9A]|uniref:Uncharacterized protein n=1 Tax=Hymenobacter caeli TaxID=2735894 RepID=A0ABX2FSU1_9BACT|nr:hypothetical protein [Hymenobacter caeli]
MDIGTLKKWLNTRFIAKMLTPMTNIECASVNFFIGMTLNKNILD